MTTEQLSRRRFLGTSAAVAGTAVAATRGPAPRTAQAQDKTTITWWTGFTGPDQANVEHLVEQFNQASTSVQVELEITPWENLMPKLLTTMSAGEGPDVVAFGSENYAQYASEGLLLDISDAFAAGGPLDGSQFSPSILETLQYEGKQYGAPMLAFNKILFYNKDLFVAAGLDPETPPDDWDAWIAAAKATTTDGRFGYAIPSDADGGDWRLFVWGNGGDFVTDGTSYLSDPKTVEALALWAGLIENDKISPPAAGYVDAETLFNQGQSAMHAGGPWWTPNAEKMEFEVGAAPIPAGPAGRVTQGHPLGLAVNANSKNKDAALELFTFWTSQESQRYWSSQTGFPPIRLDLADDEELAKNRFLPIFAEGLEYTREILVGVPNQAEVQTEVIGPLVTRVSSGESVEDAVAEAEEKLDGLL